MLRRDVFFAERKFSEIYCITEVEKAAEMYSYSSKRKREDELLAVPSVSRRQGMNFRTSPVISGSYIEVEPCNQRFVPSTVGSGFQSNGATRMPDGVELYETNRLLNDDQIQRFISSTVLPHHRALTNSNGRTLANSDGVSWSQAPPDTCSRPAQPKKIKNGNYAYPNLVEDLQRRPVPQGNPVLLSVPQGTQRGFQGNRPNFYQKTQGTPTGVPHEFSVPQEIQEFWVPQETHGNAFSIPPSTVTQAVSGHQEGISTHNIMSEGISKFPQGIQDRINSFPRGTQRGFQEYRTNFYHKTQGKPTGYPRELNVPQGRQDVLIPQETHVKAFSIPLSTGTQAVSGYHGDTSYHNRMNEEISTSPQGIRDEIISFPRGLQREISRVSKLNTEDNDILQEINITQEEKPVDFPKGTLPFSHGPSGLEETEDDIIIVHQGTPEDLISVVQETLQEIMGVPQGNSISQGTTEEVMGIPNQITVYDETGKEITGFTPETMEEIMGITQEITIPQGSVEEIMGIPEGNTIPQETLHEIMGIMASVPDETLNEIMGFPQGIDVAQGIAVPRGTQGQASPVQNQNMWKGNSGVDCQEQKSFWKPDSEMAPTSQLTAKHQFSPSYNQSQKDSENSLVKDTMNHDHEFNGTCRKRKREASGEDTSGKRQNRGQASNLDTENNYRDAGLKVLPERTPESEEFFASIDKCLELSSENIPSKKNFDFLDDLDNTSLETFPSKVIDDIYKNTFESDCFLVSDDDFVTDSLAFLKQGGDFGLGGLW